ncbi:hypothetical protein FQN57_004849 [Myotisia sp. PD_48]|nr:hypothetical protein FQN57_004849 [Myotisia sp. PD_48]
MWSRVEIGLHSITLLAGIESLLLIKNYNSFSGWMFTVAFPIFTANYICLFVYSTLVYPEFISPLRRIPRGKWWLPRKLHRQLILGTTSANALYKIAQETPNDGVIALREATGFCLAVTKPHVIAELLVHRAAHFQKPEPIRALLNSLTGGGIFSLEGDTHRYLRKKSLPHFGFRAVKDLYPLMWNHALKFAESLENELVRQHGGSNQGGPPSGKLEFTRWSDNTTVDIIGTTLFGREFKALDESKDSKFDKAVQLLNVVVVPSVEMQLYLSLSVFFSMRLLKMIPWRMNQKFEETMTRLKKTCIELVEDKRTAIKEGGQHVDILSQMIESKDFSDTQISAELITYMLAGNDTTSITMSWACYLLAVDQVRQDTLRKEVREVLGPDVVFGEDIVSLLDRLPYLNGVINETLRLYPSVPVTPRMAICDTTLGGFHIPKGTDILVSAWATNRSPELWGPTADKFEPERWISYENGESGSQKLNPLGGSNSNYDFLTFIHGPRSCIGQGFARAELRCLLAVISMQFEWALDGSQKEVVPKGAITSKPGNGLHLRLKRVDLGPEYKSN